MVNSVKRQIYNVAIENLRMCNRIVNTLGYLLDLILPLSIITVTAMLTFHVCEFPMIACLKSFHFLPSKFY